MLRWIILLVTFSLWVGCLAIVYWQCKPIPIIGAEAAARATLDRIFAEDSVDRRAWNIYTDAASLDAARARLPFAGAQPAPASAAPKHKKEWNGMDERGLILVGHLETLLKNKRNFNVDEETTLTLELPGTGLKVDYNGSAHMTFDNGLEQCKMDLKLKFDALELDAKSSGTREGETLVMNTSVYNNGTQLYSARRDEKIGGNTALTTELAPFQYNQLVKPGMEWTIVTLDLDLIMRGEMQSVKAIPVKCIGDTTIKMNGVPVRAFEVRSDDGSARAWYSTGNVMKQTFRLAGVLDVVFVRDDTPAK